MTNLEYLFIGAGLANLAAARNLFDRGEKRIAVLDAGRKLDNRKCPGVEPQKCIFCERSCSILSGVGGTNALYGNKMCYFPASSGILNSFKDNTVNDAWNWLDDVLNPWFKSGYNQSLSKPNDLGIKLYESEVLSQNQFKMMIDSLAAPLVQHNLIQQSTRVLNIYREKQGFTVLLESGATLRSRKVVLGVGRAGEELTRRVCDSLGVQVRNNLPDVGFRIEAPKEYFSHFYHYQEDPKLKKAYRDGTVRTFCAENGGVIVPVIYRDAYYAEGAYPQSFGSENNVALMVRSNDPLPEDLVRDWCVEINKRYESLKIEEVNVSGLSSEEMMNKVSNYFPHLPTTAHNNLMKRLVSLLSSSKTPLFRASHLSMPVKIYGPAIDNYWPIPDVGFELHTSVPGFFIVGDSLGLSRGYVQALTCGVAWALTQEINTSSQIAMRKETCLALV